MAPLFTMRPRFLTLALLFCLAAVACSGGKGEGSAAGVRAPGVIRISQGSDLLSFDPYYMLESPSFNIQRNVFDPLVDYDAKIKVVPCLAEKWELKSPTVWEFKLRRGVRFQEGQPFTADDVVYSIRRARQWALSRVKSEIPTVKDVRAVDDYTVQIETSIPDAILPLRLASILILSRQSCEPNIKKFGEDWLATHANGTGPYRVKRWRKDEVCDLVANEKYWGQAPSVREMQFIPTSNDAARMAALIRGELDVMINVPPRYVKQAEKVKGYRIVKNPSLRLIYLGLDCGRDKTPGVASSPPSPLKDLRVRQAIAAGIDNRLIVRTIMKGNADPADQLMPEGVTGYDPSIRLKRPDRELARRLLAEAGYPKGFTVRLDGPNDRYVNDADILQAIAGLLARIGITVEVNATPKARFFSDEKQGNCSFFLIGWANTNGDGAGTFEHLLHTISPASSMGDSNTSTNYSNPQVDKLCERASGEFDPARRNALLQEANRLVVHDLPHIPLHFQMDIYAVSERVEWTPRRDTQVRGVDVRVRGVDEGGSAEGGVRSVEKGKL